MSYARWPADWAERLRGKDCPFCASGRPEEDQYGIRIRSSEVSDAYLQKRDVGQHGYSIVVWRGRHVAEPTELNVTEAAAYWNEVLAVSRAVERHFRPLKMNLMLLGNAVPHLHTHVVPRYADDGAPGGPPLFFARSPDSEPLIDDAALRRDASALRALLGAVDSGPDRSS